jgi:hypothetical protein
MKLKVVLGLVVLATPFAGLAQTAPKAAAPAKAAAKAGTGAEKKAEEPAKIEGFTLNRPNGGFLGLEIKGGNFVVTFYNKEKKKTAVDVARAVVRWPVKYQPLDERTVLNPGGPDSLTSSKVVRPPHNFKVYLSLFVAGNETPVESHVIDYRGETPAGVSP